jgi:hypothetical protein
VGTKDHIFNIGPMETENIPRKSMVRHPVIGMVKRGQEVLP